VYWQAGVSGVRAWGPEALDRRGFFNRRRNQWLRKADLADGLSCMFESEQFSGDHSHGSTSHSLLERIRSRDPAAWQRFVYLYGPVIFRWTKRARLQASDGADVTQEVFHAVSENIQKFRRDTPGVSFRGWLWGITRNKVRDHFRRMAPDQGVGGDAAFEQLHELPHLPDESSEPISALTAELAHRALQLIQNEFETSTWQAFLRCTVEKASASEVAAELGLTVAAVYKAKSRVLQRLRLELDGLLD
jgi:RNA polymerase sigma-70 factor (ECF subfamily)